MKLTIEEMQNIAKERNGKCLSYIYTNNSTKLLWECSKAHQWSATPRLVKMGSWCPFCSILIIKEKLKGNSNHKIISKYTIEDMRVEARKRGGKCISKYYTNNSTKLKWMCKKNHEFEMTPFKFLQKHWCLKCHLQKRKEEKIFDKKSHNQIYKEEVRRKKEAKKEYKKNFYQENKEKFKSYKNNNKEAISKYSKEYRKKHKEKIAKYFKEYKAKNKEKFKEYRQKYLKKKRVKENIKEI